MSNKPHRLVRFSFLLSICLVLIAAPLRAQINLPQTAPPAPRTQPVGLPQDAAPHDNSTIEWWYWNGFLKTQSGRNIAVVASFFRTGIGARKGHYLIYSLADLDKKTADTYSILDQANLKLLKGYLPLVASRTNDPRPMQLLALLQQGKLPAPHKALPTAATLTANPLFSIAFGNDNTLAQMTADARNWSAKLKGDKWNLDLQLAQPKIPPMLVGGEGKTGLNRPDDMYYLSITHMDVTGKITLDGVTETVTGQGWIDRQWGTSWVVQNNGWDWLGLHLDDGSDLIVYQVKNNDTHKVLRAEATLLKSDGSQSVEPNPIIKPSGNWTDLTSGITYPNRFEIVLPTMGLTFAAVPVFPKQTIPVIGIGDAIWEGVVTVTGKKQNGEPLGGRGYLELVGYAAPKVSNPLPRPVIKPVRGTVR